MPQISFAQLNASKILIGPKRIKVMGATDDNWVISMMGDMGGVVPGIDGDSYHFGAKKTVFEFTLNVFPTSTAIGEILKLAFLRNMFEFTAEMNDFSFNGWMTVINPGEWSASASSQSRAFTAGLTYVSGNIFTGVGEVVQSGV